MAIVFLKTKAKRYTYALLSRMYSWYSHRLVAEALDELDIEGKTIGIASVGCTYSYDYFGCDMIQAPHGRTVVATGSKKQT